jgi:hypothetical protein
MGQFRSVVLLMLVAIALMAAPGAIRAQDAPTPVETTTARQMVDGEADQIKAVTAQVNAHRWPPAYYDPPCTPNKENADAELGPFRKALREHRAEVARLKNEIAALERRTDNQLVMNDHGWDPNDTNRFRAVDTALSALQAAIKAQEDKLDAMKPLKCAPPPPPPPPPPYNPGPDERIIGGPAIPQPGAVSFQPLAMPDHFCSLGERSRYFWSKYDPWSTAMGQAVADAFNYAGRLQERYYRLAHDLPTGDPQIEAAKRTWDYADAKAREMAAEVKKLRDDAYRRLNAVPIVACAEDGRAIDPPPPPPPPHYFDTPHRPVLLDLRLPKLPDHFCSEDERYHYLMDVYFPLARQSGDNTRAANGYMYELTQRMQDVTMGSDAWKALDAEYRAYDPIRRAANAFDDELTNKIRPAIGKIPIRNCAEKPVTDGPVTTPQPPPVDGGPRTGQLPPGLVRPQLERVPDITAPQSFCSEEDRVRFLNTVYNPAAAAATSNAQATHAYRVHLNELFTQYMKQEGGPVWAAIQKEMAEWAPIDDAARAKSEAMGALYRAIMATPVVPCPEKPPVTDGPTGGGHAGGQRLPEPPVLDAVPGVVAPERFCTREELEAYVRRLYAAEHVLEGNLARARAHMAALAGAEADARAAGDKEAAQAAVDAQAAYRPTLTAISDQLAALDFRISYVRRIPVGCPPPTATSGGLTDGPVGGAPRRPMMISLELAIPPRFCTNKEKEDFLKRADDALEVIEDNMDALEDYGDDLDATEKRARADGRWTEGLKQQLDGEDAWIDANYRALDDLGAAISRLMWMARMAPVGCPDDHRTTTGPQPPPVTDGGGHHKKPCPPGHKPIDVGPNGKVGSGARTKEKVASTALGVVGGLLGGGGGGGGGSDGPQLLTCRIKDKDLTVFDDPATGISLAVGAKEGKGGTTIFAKINKSPDSGTFQTAFLENADGDQQAPKDVGICGLWGEWQLTVSWTKTTYVDGQVVSREEGGWSKSGTFGIPGVLSGGGAKPDGLWKRLGFSNASHGAREIALSYRLTPEDFARGPIDIVIHVTRPGQKEVTTTPFVLRMTRGPGGITFEREDKDPCDEPGAVKVGDLGEGMTACRAATPGG